MRRKRGWAGTRLAVVTLLLGLGTAASVQANTMNLISDYSTSGAISMIGVDGPNVISFNSVAGGSFQAPSAFSLGEFLVGALPEGVTTTYTDTPFQFTYITQKVNGETPSVNQTVTLTGKLNGAITGSNQSSVVASFDPMDTDPTFRTGDFLNTLRARGSVLLVPSSNNGGRTTIQARLASTFSPASPVPEPTTLAVLVVAGLGLGLRRRLRARTSLD